MTKRKLFTVRYKKQRYLLCSAFNNNIQPIEARSKSEALKKGRKWFGHICYIV